MQDHLASLRAIRRGVFLVLSRLMCGPAVAAAGKSTMHSSRPRRRSRQPMHRKPPSRSIPASAQTGVVDHVAFSRRFRGRTRPPRHDQSRDQKHQSRPSERPCQTVVEPEQPGARIPAHCSSRLEAIASRQRPRLLHPIEATAISSDRELARARTESGSDRGSQMIGRTTSIPRLETRRARSSANRSTCSLAGCSKRSTSTISAIST